MAETNFNTRGDIGPLAPDDVLLVWDTSLAAVKNITALDLAAEMGDLTTAVITEADSPYAAAGGLIIVSASASAPVTIQIPQVSTEAAGWSQRIWNRSAQPVTLDLVSGSDQFERESGAPVAAGTSLVSAGLAGEKIEIIGDGVSVAALWKEGATLTTV